MPGGRNDSFVTHPSTNANNPRFAEVFALPIAEAKLVSQTLQVLVCCVLENGRDHCLVSSYPHSAALVLYDIKYYVTTLCSLQLFK